MSVLGEAIEAGFEIQQLLPCSHVEGTEPVHPCSERPGSHGAHADEFNYYKCRKPNVPLKVDNVNFSYNYDDTHGAPVVCSAFWLPSQSLQCFYEIENNTPMLTFGNRFSEVVMQTQILPVSGA